MHREFDFRVIELFDELAKRDPLPERLRDTYWRIKTALGRRPTRVDVYEGSDIPIREYSEAGGLGSWILWASLPTRSRHG